MDEQFLSLVHNTIEENISNENFNVEELAQTIGLSRSMLHRKLKGLTGKSASDLITEKRLARAKELLENNVATAAEIAYKVGFSDPSYFNKVFKKHFNVNPGDIRKKGAVNQDHLLNEKGQGKPASRRSKRAAFIITVIIVAVIIAGTGMYFIIKSKPVERSVAVLPLDNLTGVPENSHVIDGMQDALIGELGQIKTIRVISRTSTLRYRDKEMLLPEIAKELGVNTIVEGSVHCLGDSLCLVVQLIDVFPEERHLLANEYRDDMHNALKIQKTAVKDIAHNIHIKLTKDQEQLLTETRQVDPETYKDYLRGLYQLGLGTPESFEAGIQFMKKAIKKDPGEPLAHAGLSLGYALLGHGYLEDPDAFRTAEAAANKALKLDPYLDEAYVAIGMLNLCNLWDWQKSREALENAIAKNPNNEMAHAFYAWYHVMYDNKEKSLYHAKMATVLEPLSPAYYSWLAWLCVFFEEFEQAETAALKSLELMENLPYGNVTLGWVYLHKKKYQKAIETHEKLPLIYPFFKMVLAYTYVQAGEMEKAIALRNEVEEQAKQSWVNPFERGLLAGMTGDIDTAFELLEEAVEHHYYPTNHINVIIPGMKFLEHDPRYNELFEKMNLPAKRPLIASE